MLSSFGTGGDGRDGRPLEADYGAVRERLLKLLDAFLCDVRVSGWGEQLQSYTALHRDCILSREQTHSRPKRRRAIVNKLSYVTPIFART